MAISKTHIRVYPLDAIQQFDSIFCYFMVFFAHNFKWFICAKKDWWSCLLNSSTRLAQNIFWFISYNSIYVLDRCNLLGNTYNQYIFGLFRIIQHISITFVQEFVTIQISCKTSWLLFQTVMWDIGYPNVLSDGVQNQLQVQSILKRGTFCQMGHWKSKEKFSLLLRFEGIESHDFSILNLYLSHSIESRV